MSLSNATIRSGSSSSLSARLLVFTLLFVMLSEVMVFLPSIARFRERYLEERLATAHVAILALEAMPDGMLKEDLVHRLLGHAGAYAVTQNTPDGASRRLQAAAPPPADLIVDLRLGQPLTLVAEALIVFLLKDNRILHVIGPSTKEPDVLMEITIDEEPMRAAMVGYSTRILLLSLVIALFTGALVYLSLHWLMVTPMRRLAENMMAFRNDPEDPTRIIKPSRRSDEIGLAEKQLAFMQSDIRASLVQKARLAAVGEAVAKVNHDLRNILANAMLQGEKLADVKHAKVRKIVPALFETIDKAVDLCRRTLDFVSNPQDQIQPVSLSLHDFIEETVTPLFNEAHGAADQQPRFVNAVPPDMLIHADPRQLARALTNLVHNALEAGAKQIFFQARQSPSVDILLVEDNGPGLPPPVQSKLFRPFVLSSKPGGSGLGLAIVKDIMRAHNGDVRLERSDHQGAIFKLIFPAEKRHETG